MAKGVGGGGRIGRAGGVSAALKTLLPSANRGDLNMGAGGLQNARTLVGDEIDTLMYNPNTGTLLAGGGGDLHAELQQRYAPRQRYDDFVKITYNPWGSPPAIHIDASRTTFISATDQWNAAFNTAEALVAVGYARSTPVVISAGDAKRSFTLADVT